MKKNKDIKALYIHIPFCHHICDYCDFPKLQYFRSFAEKYLVSLEKEIEQYHINKNLETIYIGGGTPTALDDDLFYKLLSIVKPYSGNIKEYTIETNPESLLKEKLEIMKSFGVNRISIGVESTDDEILKMINRHHTFSDVKTAILSAKEKGFDNLNVDLIIGLPNVNKARFIKDLDNILSLDVAHISCYSLTVHPNTVFFINGINEPTDEYARELYDIAEKKLSESGFIHYEVSNWAKPGRESLHNMTYWKDDEYYGVGLSASGYVNGVRYTNTRSINKYLEGEYVAEQEAISLEDDKTYYVMLSLRTNRGIDMSQYQKRFDEDLLSLTRESINGFIKDGLLIMKNNCLIPTYDGMMVLDQIIMELTK